MRNGSANANTINLFIIIFIWIPIQTLYYRTINTTQHTHDTHEGHKYPAATIPCCSGTGDDALEWLATHQPKYELVAGGLIGNLSTPPQECPFANWPWHSSPCHPYCYCAPSSAPSSPTETTTTTMRLDIINECV